MSLGNALKNARESAGLSVEDLAAASRIRASLIRDFEKNNFAHAGGSTYARGHLRVLAQIIGVDSEELLSQFDDYDESDQRLINVKLADNNATPERRIKKPLPVKALAGVAAGIVALALTVQGVIMASHVITKPGVSLSEKKTASSTIVANKVSGVSLQMKGVSGVSWVSVTDSAGAPIFSGMITAGQIQTFTDSQLLRAVIGNAAAVHLTLNGQDLGIAGAQGEVRHLQFTPEGSTQG